MAVWMQHDQAVSLGVELGLVPPELAAEVGDAGGVVCGDGNADEEAVDEFALEETPGDDGQWQETVDLAFSESGDVLEGWLLDSFNSQS